MNLMENVGRFFRSFAEKQGVSIAKLHAITEISRNMIYTYSKGEGNLSLGTLEHIAVRLDVSPLTILMGVYAPENKEASVLLVNTMRSVAELPLREQQRFIRLLIVEMMNLWDEV